MRVVPALAIGVLLVPGCAPEAPSERMRTKIVKRYCTTTVGPDVAFCETKRNCPEIATCAEAYYRYTTCKHLWLDGGAAVPRDGQPNGIPCENRCKRDALAMAKEIRDGPFSPPTLASTVCDPA